MSTTPDQVVRDALSGELRLILSLAGVTTGVGGAQAVTDADGMLDDLTRVVLTALRDAGFAVVELPKLGPADEIRVIDGMVVDMNADVWRSPDEASTEAAALLAAAEAAERGES